MVDRTIRCGFAVFRLTAGLMCLGQGGWLDSKVWQDQMTTLALQDSWLKGDRTVFGLRHAASAVLFK